MTVVNLARDQDAGAQVAKHVRDALIMAPTLAPLPPGELSRALEERLAPPESDRADLEAAHWSLARAREALARFEYDAVLAHLDDAEARLLGTWPSPRWMALLSDLAFERGLLFMRVGLRAEAVRAFELVHRLDPERGALHPARHPPAIVAAFDDAANRIAAPAPVVRLAVTSAVDGAQVYVDGRAVGVTPHVVELSPGRHYITGTFADRRVAGRVLDIDVSMPRAEFALPFAALDSEDLARQWRLVVIAAPRVGDGAPALDITELTRRPIALADRDAVIAIADGADGTLYVAGFDARTQTEHPWAPATRVGVQRVVERFAELPRALTPDSVLAVAPPTESETVPWIRTTWGRGVISAGIAAALITGALLTPRLLSREVSGSCCTDITFGLGVGGGFSFP
ncbi:PEGA domain-containing protein [Haliangium sp.]|uniref:PEGA domain-containing protein n=1 Tax=Haliangium sp. TaxID=2663208 RepID=UPI003D0D3E06